MADIVPKVKSEESVDSELHVNIKKERVINTDQTSGLSNVFTNDEIPQAINDLPIESRTVAGNIQPEKKVRKRKRVRGKRRSKRLKLIENRLETQLSNNAVSSTESEDEYCLIVSNLPNNWSYIEIKNYIDTECGRVDEIEFVQGKSKDESGSIRLYFPTKTQCEKAKAKLENNVVESKKLSISIEDLPLDSDSMIESDKELTTSQNLQWSADLDILDADPSGLYGLKPEFLESLDIKPPLDRWVFVTNFRCDKSELRDVLELAGHVLLCSVLTDQGKYARVLYSHPLEAVQAISMLNGQKLYGKKLKIVMDRCKDGLTVLPKGLLDVGLGLGIYGKPLRNIEKHYKRHITQRSSLVNPLLFSKHNETNKSQLNEQIDLSKRVIEIKSHMDEQKKSLQNKNIHDASSFMVKYDKDHSDSDCSESNDKKVNEIKTITSIIRKPASTMSPGSKNVAKQVAPIRHLVTPPVPAAINPNFINGVTSMNVRNAEPGPPGIEEFRPSVPVSVRPAFGPRPGPVRPEFPIAPNLRPMPRPGLVMGPRPMPAPAVQPVPFVPGPRPLMSNTMVPGPFRNPRPFGPQPMPNLNSTTVRMRNLPLDTTFPYLCEKLSGCGQVLSLQLTEPGCAVVTFGNRQQAEKCFQTYNNVRVNNCTIEVQFI